MISIEWNEKSVDSLYSKLERLASELPVKTKEALEKASENTRDKALEHKRGMKSKDLIIYKIEVKGNDTFVSKIHTDEHTFSWASFLEYGTGRYAEREHIGKTKTFFKSGFYFWYAPFDKVKAQYSDENYFEFEGEQFPMNANFNGQKYVLVFEQKAQPFMRPAAFETRKETVDIMRKELSNMIKEVFK